MPWPIRPAPTTPIFTLFISNPFRCLLRHGRACPGHPRLEIKHQTWMPGTRPGMTPSRESPRGIAAVHVHDLAGAEVRRRRKQINRHADQVLDLPQPAERNTRQRERLDLLPDRIVAVHPG